MLSYAILSLCLTHTHTYSRHELPPPHAPPPVLEHLHPPLSMYTTRFCNMCPYSIHTHVFLSRTNTGSSRTSAPTLYMHTNPCPYSIYTNVSCKHPHHRVVTNSIYTHVSLYTLTSQSRHELPPLLYMCTRTPALTPYTHTFFSTHTEHRVVTNSRLLTHAHYLTTTYLCRNTTSHTPTTTPTPTSPQLHI